MADIDKKELERIAVLARLKLDPAKEDKLLSDFSKILDHFNELKEVKTVPAGQLRAHRAHIRDDGTPTDFHNAEGIRAAFPEREGDYLKIPPVFE